MKESRTGRKVAAQCAAVALVAGGMTAAIAMPAQADTFNPGNDLPTVTSVTDTNVMQPDSGTGDTVYTVNATVGDANSLQDLNTVTACLYDQSAGDATCTTQNPANTAKITWDRATDSFAIDASSGVEASNWELGAGGDSQASTNTASYALSNYSAVGTSMVMRFTFRVSDVALEGTDWAVRVVADDGDATATANDTAGYTMGYYSRVQTQRVSQSLGEPTTESTQDTNTVSGGFIVANGGTDLQLATDTFTDGTVTLANAGSTLGSAVTADRTFALEADADATFDAGGNAIRLSASLADIETGVLTTGTTEVGDSSLTQGFRLYNGGGIPRLGSAYSATVTVGVTQDA